MAGHSPIWFVIAAPEVLCPMNFISIAQGSVMDRLRAARTRLRRARIQLGVGVALQCVTLIALIVLILLGQVQPIGLAAVVLLLAGVPLLVMLLVSRYRPRLERPAGCPGRVLGISLPQAVACSIIAKNVFSGNTLALWMEIGIPALGASCSCSIRGAVVTSPALARIG
jgi:hypothetical protein